MGSAHGHEIENIKVVAGEFVTATTSQSLICGNLTTRRFSEVLWTPSGRERFFCDDPAMCLVYNMGELTAIEVRRGVARRCTLPFAVCSSLQMALVC